MRVGPLAVGIFVAIASMAVAVWALKTEPRNKHDVLISPPKETGPGISPNPPYPKAVAVAPEFDFGIMESGQKGKHTFVIRNDGDSPLKLMKGDATCKCTKFELTAEEVPPGQSAKVHLEWRPPDAKTDLFNQQAPVLTNDPEHKKIILIVKGKVTGRLHLSPSQVWQLDDINDEKPREFTGNLYSPVLDKFKVVSVTSANPLLTAEATPLSGELLKEFNAKSGYAIHITLKPGLPIGRFELPLQIKTDVPERKEDGTLGDPRTESVYVTGNRRGPIQILGANWIEEEMTVAMGTFDARLGKKVRLNLFVSGGPPEGLKILDSKSVPSELKVSLEPDPKMKGKSKHYFLVFEFPPGAAKSPGDNDRGGSVTIRTNHPLAPNFDFKVFYGVF